MDKQTEKISGAEETLQTCLTSKHSDIFKIYCSVRDILIVGAGDSFLQTMQI